jgi:hypothetical protein
VLHVPDRDRGAFLNRPGQQLTMCHPLELRGCPPLSRAIAAWSSAPPRLAEQCALRRVAKLLDGLEDARCPEGTSRTIMAFTGRSAPLRYQHQSAPTPRQRVAPACS